MQLSAAAQTLRAAKEEYLAAFRTYFARDVPCLSPEMFARLHAVFRQEVVTYCLTYRRTNGVEQAAWELFRKPIADHFSQDGKAIAKYTLAEAASFAKSWPQLTRQLEAPLIEVVEWRGDDGYRDLLDALPLAGLTIVERAVRQEFRDHRQFEQAVNENCQDHPQLARIVLYGENYVGMALEDAAREAFLLSPPE